MLAASFPAHAQAPAPERAGYSQDELDQLLAPVALYPDQLLAQVLMAATYPLEVVQAARFVQQNPSLAGDALDEAVAQRNWDPSVQSLTAFPQVLAMMNENLEWTERLGDAVLADQQRVMDTVQRLRQRAEATGSLRTTEQQIVTVEPDVVVIAPAQPDVIYVPVYDPLVVYGPWWAPAYPPWFWYPPPIYGYPIGPVFGIGVVFGIGHVVSHHHWGWAHPDWHGRHIEVDAHDNRFWNRPGRRPPPSGTWQHSPEHRRGVAYPDPITRDRFAPIDPTAVRRREDFRGRDLVPPAPPRVAAPSAGQARPAPVPPAAASRSAPSASVSPGPRPIAPPAAESRTPAPRGTAPGTASAPLAAPRPIAPPAGGMVPNAPSAPLAAPRPIAPPATQAAPRALAPSAPMFDPGVSRRQAQENAMRGFESRRSVPLAPPPTMRAPAPSMPRAPSPAPAMRAPAAPAAPSRPPAALSAPSRAPAAVPAAPPARR
ncbi:MAG: DUF3300 domain-containing protein [Rudaea sp.]